MQVYEGNLDMVGRNGLPLNPTARSHSYFCGACSGGRGGRAPGRAEIRRPGISHEVAARLRALGVAREIRLSLEGGTVSYDGDRARQILELRLLNGDSILASTSGGSYSRDSREVAAPGACRIILLARISAVIARISRYRFGGDLNDSEIKRSSEIKQGPSHATPLQTPAEVLGKTMLYYSAFALAVSCYFGSNSLQGLLVTLGNVLLETRTFGCATDCGRHPIAAARRHAPERTHLRKRNLQFLSDIAQGEGNEVQTHLSFPYVESWAPVSRNQ